MAERNFTQGELQLNIAPEYLNTLDIEGFSLMLKSPSYCYKFYWLEALVHIITEGKTETTFDEIIDEMIVDAWYSVCEFHIHLSGLVMGEARDGLEKAINTLRELSGLAPGASRVEIKNAIAEHNSELKKYKTQLTNMVPYRALAGFFDKGPAAVCWENRKKMTEFIRDFDTNVIKLPYVLGDSSQLNREVYIDPVWAAMIKDNAVAILGWIQYEKVRWLQTNNPEVPGLVYKLAPMDEKMRKLSKVHDLWDGVIALTTIKDTFTGKLISGTEYDVDHFIPWSFVMNDELWNLMPMDSSLNSAKSNKLPKWDPFFRAFAGNQYKLYELINSNETIHDLYAKCLRDNLHSIWAQTELYRAGNDYNTFVNILESNMRPLYDSANRQGYELWQYGREAKIYSVYSKQQSAKAASKPTEYGRKK